MGRDRALVRDRKAHGVGDVSALIAWAWPYLIAAGAALLGVWKVWATGKRAGRNEERIRHAQEREENLNRIKRAANARPSGRVSDDPYNRDR